VARKTSAAGRFYPADPGQLDKLVSELIKGAEIDSKAYSDSYSFVSPHAGYAYSGSVAAYAYSVLQEACRKRKIDTLVIIGPNHAGYGEPIAVSLQDWQTPLGLVENDIEFSRMLAHSSSEISDDETAHAYEHSIEVQLPFVQKTAKGTKCVFICMGDQSYYASLMLADAIFKSCELLKRSAVVIASSDFNHYESAAIASEKDMPAIEELLRLDANEFIELIHKNKSSACGHGPIAVAALFAAKNKAKKGVLLKYANSGDITKDYSSVVAYASMAFV